MTLRNLWDRYVNADHFVIGTVAVALATVLHLSPVVPWIVLLFGGAIHEYLDGDLTSQLVVPPHFKAPWEGLKDMLWFLLPMLLYLL